MEKSIASAGRQIFSLNLIRAIAIIMVIFDHSLRQDLSPALRDLFLIILNPNATLFFMVSGALLLPITGSYGDFIRHRIMKIFVPFVVWVIIYSLAYYHLDMLSAPNLGTMIRWDWLSYNFEAGWFIPAMMGVYLVMPIISPWIISASRRNFLYVIALWLISGMLPLFQALGGINPASTSFVPFLNAIPFAIMGYYIMRYKDQFPLLMPHMVSPTSDDLSRRRSCQHRQRALFVILPLLVILIPWLLRNAGHSVNIMQLSIDKWGLPMIITGILYFTALIRVKSLGRIADSAVNFLARYSYGIYLSHELICRLLLPRYAPDLSSSTIATFAITFATSLILTIILKKIPFLGRYII